MNWLFLRLSCLCSSASLLWLPLFSWSFTGWSQYIHQPLPPGKHTHSNSQILLIWTIDVLMWTKSMEKHKFSTSFIFILNGIILSHVMKGRVPVDWQRNLSWLAKIFCFLAVLDNMQPAMPKASLDCGFFCDINQNLKARRTS